MSKRTFIILFFSLCISASAHAQSWFSAGRLGQPVTAICGNTYTGDIIAGTDNGLWATADTGKSWHSIMAASQITALNMRNDTVLVGTTSGLLVGKEGGPWTLVQAGVWVTYIMENGIFGTKDGKLYSTNTTNLLSWYIMDSVNGPGDLSVTGITLSPNGQEWYASTASGPIMRSTNGGTKWTVITPSLSFSIGAIVGISYEFDSSLLIATSEGGTARSKDRGASWQAWSNSSIDLHTTGIVSRFGNWNYLATTAGIDNFTYYLFNGSLDTVHWEPYNSGLPSLRPIGAISIDASDQVHCALADGSVYTQWHNTAFRRVFNTKSNLPFPVTNTGIDFYLGNGQTGGLNWPRGTNNGYIFGGGLWFAARKNAPNSPEALHGWSSAGSSGDRTGLLRANSISHHLDIINGSRVSVRADVDPIWSMHPAPFSFIPYATILPNGKLLLSSTRTAWTGEDAGPFDTTGIYSKIGIIGVSNEGIVLRRDTTYIPNATFTHWTAMPSTLGASSALSISSIGAGARILVATSSSLYRSSDFGRSWNMLPISAAPVSVAFASDSSIVLLTVSDLERSTDDGTTWNSTSGLIGTQYRALKTNNGQDFGVWTDSGLYRMTITSGGQFSILPQTEGTSWGKKIAAFDIDRDGAMHVLDSLATVWTQWSSPTLKHGVLGLCELGYDPNSGTGWFTPGENHVPTDGADTLWKYYPYLSTSFNAQNGSPTQHDNSTPLYRWPIWNEGGAAIKTNFNLGSYVSSVQDRESRANSGAHPVFISDEDIITDYCDKSVSNTNGYPFGLDIHESMYTWGFGRYRDMLFIRYDVTNASTDSLLDCWLAPAFDPDLSASIGGSSNDFNSYVSDSLAMQKANASDIAQLPEPYRSHPSKLDMGYQYRTAPVNGSQYGMIGFSMVESPVVNQRGDIIPNADSVALNGYGPQSSFAQDQLGLKTFRSWNINNDPPSDELRYAFASSGARDLAASSGADQRVMMATGPFTLAPGQHVSTTVAITIAQASTTDAKKNFGALLQLAAFAKDFFATSISVPTDSSKTIIQHFGGNGPAKVEHGSSSALALSCYPNPATKQTVLHFELPSADAISVEIHDVTGRCVARPVTKQMMSQGAHDLEIDLEMAPSGNYITKLVGSTVSASQAITVAR